MPATSSDGPSRDGPAADGQLAAAISTAVVHVFSDHTGRGPTKARTTLDGDLVVVILQEGMTKTERALVRRRQGHRGAATPPHPAGHHERRSDRRRRATDLANRAGVHEREPPGSGHGSPRSSSWTAPSTSRRCRTLASRAARGRRARARTCSRERARDRAAQRGLPSLGRHRTVGPDPDQRGSRPRSTWRAICSARRCSRRTCWARTETACARTSLDIVSRSSVTCTDGPTGAFLPWRVGCRVHDDLAHDPPAGVMGLAAADEKAGQRLGDHGRSGLGAVHVAGGAMPR